MKNIYKSIISKFPRQKILVVGDLMVDKYVKGSVSRISPEAPVQVVEVVEEEFFPGGAGNVIKNLVSLEGKVSVLSVVGEDSFGDWLENKFNELGLEPILLSRDSLRPTTLKERIIVNHQQILRVDREKRVSICKNSEDRIVEYLRRAGYLSDFDAVIISDYAKGVVTERIAATVIGEAYKRDKPVFVDPKGIEWTKYTNSRVLTPNEKELSSIFNVVFQDKMQGKNDFLKIGKYLIDKLRLEALLVTRGESGMALLERNKKHLNVDMTEIPTRAKDVFDVTGAGDTVLSVFSLARASGAGYFEATQLANFAAGLVVSKLGTATVRRDELLEEVLRDV